MGRVIRRFLKHLEAEKTQVFPEYSHTDMILFHVADNT